MLLSEKETLKVDIDNYSGPLEVLLDLAKAQKVDLANISITQLADQFINFINRLKEINLDKIIDIYPKMLKGETSGRYIINLNK